MALKTKLTVLRHKTIKSRPIGAVKYAVKSEHMFHITRPLSEAIFHLIKSDSNDNPQIIKPSDAVFVQHKFVQASDELNLAKTYPNKGTGQLEKKWIILSAQPGELMKMPNIKCGRAAIEINRLIEYATNLNSAAMQGHVDQDELEKLANEIETTLLIVTQIIGTGAKGKDGKFDTGKPMYASGKTGQFEPELDLNEVLVIEPSPDNDETGPVDVVPGLVDQAVVA